MEEVSDRVEGSASCIGEDTAAVYLQNAKDKLPLPKNSIDLVVTSPPYFNMLDYQVAGQIGFDQSYEQYAADLNGVWSQAIYGLKDSGTVCINVPSTIEVSRDNGNEYYSPRQLVESYFISRGFYLHAEIVWELGVESYRRRVEQFPHLYPHGEHVLVHNFEYVLVFRQRSQLKPVQKGTKVSCLGSIWNVPWEYEGFPPQLSPELVSRLIDLFSREGELVFDPFSGVGTVAVEAIKAKRRFRGVELNPETYQRSMQRIDQALSSRGAAQGAII